MADYDSTLPVRGGVADGDAVAAGTTGIPALGTDGSNYQFLAVDSSGNLQTDLASALPAGTNDLGIVHVTDGTTELDVAVDGSAAKTNGVQVLGTDGTNAQILKTDTNGSLYVNTSGAPDDSVTYATANLVKDTPTTVVSQAGAAIVAKVVFTGSGLTKVEVQYGTTSSEATIAVLMNSTANPTVEFEFPNALQVASGETILLKCTNLENAASPSSDFSGYGSIVTTA